MLKAVFKYGSIIKVDPATNLYFVLPQDAVKGAPPVKAVNINEVSALGPLGVISASSYFPGTQVLFLELKSGGESANAPFGFILGACEVLSPSAHDSFPLNFHSQSPESIPFYDDLVSKLNSAASNIPEFDRNLSRAGDAIAGEFLRTNKYGGGIRLGEFVCAVGASKRCMTEYDFFTKSIRTTAEMVLQESLCSERKSGVDPSGEWSDIKMSTPYPTEGLGVLKSGTIPYKERQPTASKRGGKDPVAEEQLPFYRYEEMQGACVKGISEVIRRPNNEEDINTKTTVNPAASFFYRSFDGDVILGGSKYISIRRSIDEMIPSIKKAELLDSTLQEIEAPVPESIESADSYKPDTAPEYAAQLSALRTKRALERAYHNASQRQDNWLTPDKSQVLDALGITDAGGLDTSVNPDGYGIDDSAYVARLTDALNKDAAKEKLAALLSFIDINPDGSVVLSDGHGSEIKMHRGNMTLTCAGDMRILPGRDLHAMAGRFTSINGHEDVQLNSANGSVALKAETDMTLLSGNSGVTGKTIIESRATGGLSAEDTNPDEPLGGGILIKSASDMAVTGVNMRLGLVSSSKSQTGMAPTLIGSLVIDAGQGNLLTRSGTLSHDVSSSFNVSTPYSLLTMDTGNLTVLAQSSNFGSSSFYIGPTAGTASVPVITTQGITARNVKGTSYTGRVSVNASLEVAGTTVLETATAMSMAVGNLAYLAGGQGDFPLNPPAVEQPNLDEQLSTLKSLTDTLKDLFQEGGLFTDACINLLGFAYKSSDYLKTASHFFVESLWQLGCKGGRSWSEPVVKNPADGQSTRPYPGEESWKNKSYVRRLNEEGIPEEKGALADVYTINKK